MKITDRRFLLDAIMVATTEAVRSRAPDLSLRQMAIMLTVYSMQPPHTVRGLAAQLGLQKPAVTRALRALERFGFVKRRQDPEDRRSVLVQRTVRGSVFLTDVSERMQEAALEATLLRHAMPKAPETISPSMSAGTDNKSEVA